MITAQDLYNIVGKKLSNEIQKTIIRNNCPPQIAKSLCNAIDANESAEHFQRLLEEWNEYQLQQQKVLRQFLETYFIK